MKRKLFAAEEATEVTENGVIDEALETEVTAEKVEDPTPVEGVVEIKPEPKKEASDLIKIGKVTATSLNIRSEASLTAPVVRVVPINSELKITGETGDFFEVIGPDDAHGFCKKDFIFVV